MADSNSDSRWPQGAAEVKDTPSPAAAARGLGWDRLAVIYGLWIVVALAYWPSAVALNGYWTNTIINAYTHGYLVLSVSLWLVMRDRRKIFAAPLEPRPRALWIVAALSLLWVYCYGAAIQDPQLLLLPLLLFAAIVTALGWPIARVLYFPIGYLFFAMPAWSDINSVLEWMSVKVNDLMVAAWGIPAYLTRNYVHLPGGTLKIAAGCSGLHFFVVGLALAALYGELARDSLRRRFFWVGLMGLLSLVGNWVRIFSIIVAGYETDNKTYLITVSHYWFGWGVFVIFFIVFLWLAGVLANRWDRRGRTGSAAGAIAPTRERVAPVTASPMTAVLAGPALAALVALVVLPGIVYGANLVHPVARSKVTIQWPAPPPGWQGPQRVLYSNWRPVYLNPTARSFRRYRTADGQSVEIFAVAYRRQTQAGKLLGYWNSLLGAHSLLQWDSSRVVTRPSGRWLQGTVVNDAGIRSLMWVRYVIGKRYFLVPRLSQLWYGLAAFTTRPLSSLIALRAFCRPDCAAARARLDVAAGKLVPSVHAEIADD